VYPKPKPRGFDELSYIAGFFDTVEINTSFYGPPRPEVSQAWVERVAANPVFRFTAKLWKGFTHDRNATAEDERLFRNGMEPLIESGRLGSILVQFPWSTNLKIGLTSEACGIVLPITRSLSKCGMAVGSSLTFWMNWRNWV